jgi:hypothetical protein
MRPYQSQRPDCSQASSYPTKPKPQRTIIRKGDERSTRRGSPHSPEGATLLMAPYRRRLRRRCAVGRTRRPRACRRCTLPPARPPRACAARRRPRRGRGCRARSRRSRGRRGPPRGAAGRVRRGGAPAWRRPVGGG